MTTCIFAFGVAFVVALAATVLVRGAARRLGVVDRPDPFRKIHKRDIPRLGGVSIYLAFAVPVVLLLLFRVSLVSDLLRERASAVAALLGGGAIALGIGLVDDVRGLRARWKLLLQCVPALVATAGGFGIHRVSMPFGEPLSLGAFAVPVTVFWFLGCMNAVNLLDGLDGLAAGVCLFASLTLLLVSVFFGHAVSILLMCCLSGAILGFLVFNFHPASIFLGDSGTMLLGFLVAALSILGSRKAETAVALLIPFVALGLPIFDTALAILRRWCRRLPISAADRQHIHHVLLSMGLSQRQAVMLLYLACVVLGGAALLVTAGRGEVTVLVLGVLGIMAFVCVRVFGGLRFSQVLGRLSEEWTRRQRSAEAKVWIERVVSQMRAARDEESLWKAFSTGLETLGLDHARFEVFDRAVPGRGRGVPGKREFIWSNGAEGRTDPFPPDTWTARLRVQNNGHLLGQLEVRKAVDGSPLLEVTPELVDRLRYEMASQIERLYRDDIHSLREDDAPHGSR